MSCDLFWTYPIRLEINEDGKTVCDLLNEYKRFLETYHSERCKSFDELCCTEPEAARAEAVLFSFFKWDGYDIRVEETGNEGGVDFRAQKENTEFVIEVTSILRETFAEHSGVSENPWTSGRGVHVGDYDIAHLIRSEVSGKADQMSGYDCPRLLVTACEHVEYQTYLKKSEDVGFGADMFLTSPQVLGLPNLDDVTYLNDSLFIRFQNGRIVFCRASISAVLLFHISKYHSQVTGLLHPKPAHKFSIELLPSVPFVEALIPEKVLVSEMKDYSVEDFDNQIGTRWIPNNLPDGSFIYNQWC